MASLPAHPVPNEPVLELRSFADRIKWARVYWADNISTAKMARELGVAESSLLTWERGTLPRDIVSVSKKYANRFAAYATLAWFLDGSGKISAYLPVRADRLSVVNVKNPRLPHLLLPPARTTPDLKSLSHGV